MTVIEMLMVYVVHTAICPSTGHCQMISMRTIAIIMQG